jgi:hypothetical protein
MRVRTIFGGKDIHPNWLVGGVPAPSTSMATWPRRADQHGEPRLRDLDHPALHRLREERLCPT